MRDSRQIAAALFSVLSLVFTSVAAPEHIHAADDHHGEAIVHRHYERHDHHRSHDGSVSDDEHVIWLNAAALAQAAPGLDGSALIADLTPSGSAPKLPSWTPTVLYDIAPPHGPPRPDVPARAPPAPVL
jgi:hypothetical protein